MYLSLLPSNTINISNQQIHYILLIIILKMTEIVCQQCRERVNNMVHRSAGSYMVGVNQKNVEIVWN